MSDDFNNLIAAIRYSDFAEFKAVLAGIPNQVEALAGLDKDGSSLLECALAWAKVPIIDFLLNAKVPVNVVTKDGLNELHFAANQMNHEEMIPVVRRLVELGVDLDQKEKRYGNSALSHSAGKPPELDPRRLRSWLFSPWVKPLLLTIRTNPVSRCGLFSRPTEATPCVRHCRR